MAEGAKLATGWLELVVSTAGAQKAITDEVVPSATKAGDTAGKSLGRTMVGAAAAFAAPLAAAAGIGAVIKTGFDEVKDAAAGTAQLAAGIASTGNAANVSVQGLNDLASSIQNTTGQTDDSIVAAQSLLLTFTNIKNQGPDKIFDQATQAAADMAARMGGDASSNAILLGKALNDPVKGVTALTRVGVSFTQQQKDQIGAMVQAGDVLGAQKLILGELNKEFGGSAAAFGQTIPGQVERLKRAFEDFAQTAVGALTPLVGPVLNLFIGGLQALTPLAESFATHVGGAFTGVIDILSKGDFTSAFREATGLTEDSAVVNFLFGIRDAFLQVQATVGPIVSQLFAAIGPLFSKITSALGPAIGQLLQLAPSVSPFMIILKAIQPLIPQLVAMLSQLAGVVGGALSQVFSTLAPVIGQIAQVFGGLLTTALQAILPVIIQVVTILGGTFGQIITALLPIITLLAQVFGQIFQAISPLIGAVLGLITPILGLITPLLQLVGPILTPLIQLFTALLTPILQLVTPIIGLLVPALQLIVNVLTVVIQWIVDAITWFVKLVTGNQQAGAQFQAVWNAVMGFFKGIGQFFAGIWNGLISGISGFVGQVVGFFQAIPAKILAVFAGAGKWLLDVGKNLIQGLLDGAGTLLKNIGNFFLSIIPGWIVGPFKAALGIHSPSRVFMGLGENITAGLLIGVNGGQSAIDQTMRSLVSVPAVAGAGTGAGAGLGFPGSITLVDQDGSILARTRVEIDRSSARTATSISTGRSDIGF